MNCNIGILVLHVCFSTLHIRLYKYSYIAMCVSYRVLVQHMGNFVSVQKSVT